MFVAPPEVHQSILDVTGKPGGDIDGYDVVAWSLEQSCLSIERSQPLRVLQGLSHHQRQKSMASFAKKYTNLEDVAKETDATKGVISAFREKEEQRLTDLYAPSSLKTSIIPTIVDSNQGNADSTVQELLAIWRSVDFSVSEGASMHEEHEREVAHEVEQETQIQRPPRAKALTRNVDSSLRLFVRSGNISVLNQFRRAYFIVDQTSAEGAPAAELFTHVRVTTDFMRTVQRPSFGHHDCYLRPANWIITSNQNPKPTNLLLISQYEANQLFDDIHVTPARVKLHTYEPRVAKCIRAVDVAPSGIVYPSVLGWQSLTRSLRRELHLFAGQLYFNTFEEYRDFLVDFINTEPVTQQDGVLRFIKAWVAIRRKGQNFLSTHVGQVVSNRSIKEGAFD